MIIIQNKLKNPQAEPQKTALTNNSTTEQEIFTPLKNDLLKDKPSSTNHQKIPVDYRNDQKSSSFPPVKNTGGGGEKNSDNYNDNKTSAGFNKNLFLQRDGSTKKWTGNNMDRKQEEISNKRLEQDNFQDLEKFVDSVTNQRNTPETDSNDGWMDTGEFLDMFQDSINASNHKELKEGENLYPLLVSNIKVRLMVQMKQNPGDKSILFRFPSDREILSGISTGMYLSEVDFEMKVVPKQQIISMKQEG